MNRVQQNVAVVIPNWNGTERLKSCLRSITESSVSPDLIIVVDNGSDDIEALEATVADFDNVELIKNSANLGFSKAVNRGLNYTMRETEADYLWILNNDTIVDVQALEKMVQHLEEKSTNGICGSRLQYPSGEIVEWGGGFVNRWTGTVRSCKSRSKLKKGLDFISGASMLVRRTVIDGIGMLDEDFFFYWEDIDYCHRAVQAGWSISVVLEAVVEHEQGATLDTFHPFKIYHFNRGSILFFLKHYPKTALVPILISIFGRIVKGVLLGRWQTIPALLTGMLSGIKKGLHH